MTPLALGWFFQPLHGDGYQFWSGIGSDFGEATIATGLAAIVWQQYRHHNCHVDGCKKLGHLDPEVHAPACHKHHSFGHLRGKSLRKAGR